MKNLLNEKRRITSTQINNFCKEINSTYMKVY